MKPVQPSCLPLVMGSGFDDPYPVYRHLREASPVCRDASGMWLVSSHALVTRVLDDDRLSARPPVNAHVDDPLGYLGMVVFQAGPEHERIRKLLAPLFMRKRLADLQQGIDSKIDTLLSPVMSSGHSPARLSALSSASHTQDMSSVPPQRFDLVAQVASELPVWTICQLLGFPASAADRYLEASTGAWQLISGLPMTAQARAEAVAQTQRFLDEIEAIVDAADAGTSPDHPALYFRSMEARGEISRRDMLANILFLFIAGYGTTLLSIGNSVAAVLADRSIWRALRAEPALIPAAARELQRYDPAVQAIFRYAWADVEIGGKQVRRGEMVALLLGAANRDPEAFDHPDRIDLHRTQGRSLTFGAGPHSCMGVALARMQMESVLKALVQRLPDVSLSETGSLRMQRGAFHGFSELWLQH